MENKTGIEMNSQFTLEQLQATPKEILNVLAQYLEGDINRNRKERIFLEVTLKKNRDKVMPEIEEELNYMIKNKMSKTKINKQKKALNECINNYNQMINSYKGHEKQIEILNNTVSMIMNILNTKPNND